MAAKMVTGSARRHSEPNPIRPGSYRKASIGSTSKVKLQLKRKATLISKFETLIFGKDIEAKRGCILPDDRIMLCGSDNRLYVCNPDGKRSLRVLLQFVPSDIAIFDDKHVVVTGETGYQIVNIETMKPGPVKKPGGMCSAVACTKETIIVANDYCKLTYLNRDGDVIKSVNTSNTPYSIAASKDGLVYWTTWDNDEVHYIDRSGNERFLFSSPELSEPVAVCVDISGDVYVLGQESKNVLKVSNEGNSSKEVMKESNGIVAPYAMAMNPSKTEVMIINDKRSISIFQL